MEFLVFGALEWRGRGHLVHLGPPKQRTVLAALLLSARHVVSLDRMATCVWDDTPPTGARSVLYAHLARIRRLLAEMGGPRLDRCGGGYLLDLEPDRVDAHRFRALVDQARATPDTAVRAAALGAALRLWRGPALADLTGPWAARVRQAWTMRYLDAATGWARAELALGRAAAVVGPLTDMLEEYPLAEPLAAALMRALHASGRDADALGYFAATRHRLRDQLGIEPGVELRRAYLDIMRGAAPG